MLDAKPTSFQLDRDRVAARMEDLFGFSSVGEFSVVHGGYMSQNFRVDTDKGPYFLKQYRNRISTVVHEIKHAEEYFAGEGIPVIVPEKDRHGRAAFWEDETWFSLFPFVDRAPPSLESLNVDNVRTLGLALGRMHMAGTRFNYPSFQTLRLWDRRKFHMEVVELEHALASRESLSPLEARIREVLARKRKLVERNELLPHHILMRNDCLLHGDFTYQNVFFGSQGEVSHVYDLEKTALGPRAYELARSLLITCFDDAWTERNFRLARAFVDGYRCVAPIGFSEFSNGVRSYMTAVTHMTWIEAKFLLYRMEDHLPLYERHARRIENIGESWSAFCERVWR